MLKKLLLAACLVLPLAACTTPSATREPPKSAALAPTPGCVADTATRIAVKEADCAGFGRTYTQQDIQRTGQSDTAQALRLLDPSLTVHGH
ncbi:MAG TPA: hypothetical protein VMO54_01190 [Steroidobacteraceae bacterium]|nr:hypothetical protein [Steroidobacteraceae bacterium]